VKNPKNAGGECVKLNKLQLKMFVLIEDDNSLKDLQRMVDTAVGDKLETTS
jgi:hypothetical protein